MKSANLSRRELLRMFGMAAGVAALAACTPQPPPAPTAAPAEGGAAEPPPAPPPKEEENVTKYDLSDPSNVKLALMEEGAEVSIDSWGFSGLPETHFIPKFAEMTKKMYGVPVKLIWQGGVFGTAIRELPAAGKTIADVGIDVVDKEEENFDQAMAVNWYEPIMRDPYKPLTPNVPLLEDPYIFKGPAENGDDTYGAVYQGYEWLQALLRKDKVDVENYKDWWDLGNPELKDKIITYALANDSRGHFVFAGFVNQLVKAGQVEGELWSQPAWEGAFTEWKNRGMEAQIHKWGDLGNDPTMRMMIQTGEAWAGGLWGTYTRGLLAADWNVRDDVIHSFVPAAGCLADRETCSAVRGCKHPVAARILINWMMSTEFNTAGWYKAEGEAEATNHWEITEALFLTAYSGGVYQAMRDAIPEAVKAYYAKDPGPFLIKCDWPWYNQNAEWISKTYERIVLGK